MSTKFWVASLVQQVLKMPFWGFPVPLLHPSIFFTVFSIIGSVGGVVIVRFLTTVLSLHCVMRGCRVEFSVVLCARMGFWFWNSDGLLGIGISSICWVVLRICIRPHLYVAADHILTLESSDVVGGGGEGGGGGGGWSAGWVTFGEDSHSRFFVLFSIDRWVALGKTNTIFLEILWAFGNECEFWAAALMWHESQRALKIWPRCVSIQFIRSIQHSELCL